MDFIKDFVVEPSPQIVLDVSDPIVENYVHRHVFSDRAIYRLSDSVFDSETGGVFLGDRVIRESHTDDYSLSLRKSASVGRDFGRPIIGVPFKTHYHWLIETLPRVIAASRHEPNALIVASNHLLDTQRHALEILGLEIHYSESCHPSDEFILATYGKDSGWAHPVDMDILRRTYDVSESVGSTRIFVTRVGSRRADALSLEIHDFAARSGWTVVEAEKLSWGDHLRIFGQASVIVGEHGAGLANLALAPLGTRLVELSRNDYANPCFAALALTLNGDHTTFARYSRDRYREAFSFAS